ncbi:YicC/YloC family endoribonuclease, partial [Escherichia coli]|uniref:YicC/YloC family endoribonuclease n=1 Tax=Escherichia coli TaxID=562 RepID=UPI0028DDFC2C
EELARLIIDSANWVMKEAGQGQLNPVDVLRWPGVMADAEQDMDAVATELLGGFDLTMEDFLASRASEGANLKALIE